MAKWYAWSELRNGGEVSEVQLPTGAMRSVVLSRNVVIPGSEVSKKKLGCSDDEWDHLIAGGVIRAYPPPEGFDDRTSPTQAFLRQMVNDRGDIDMERLMELGLANPPAANPPAEEAKEIPVGV